MRKWALPIVASALTVAILGASFAGAARKPRTHRCSFDLTGLFSQVKVNSGSPPVNGSDTDGAIIDGKFCGKTQHGAARLTSTYTSTSPTSSSFTGKVTSFGPRGSLKGTATGSGSINSDGSVSFSGSGKIRGGTGAYKGARGSFTFTGSIPPGSDIATQHITGRVRY